jgi:hypothetical protein
MFEEQVLSSKIMMICGYSQSKEHREKDKLKSTVLKEIENPLAFTLNATNEIRR